MNQFEQMVKNQEEIEHLKNTINKLNDVIYGRDLRTKIALSRYSDYAEVREAINYINNFKA